MDLETFEETVEPEAEVYSEAAPATTEATPELDAETEGFPQLPDEDIDATFEATLHNDAQINEEEAPTVHVLEWDMEEDSEEAVVKEEVVDESDYDLNDEKDSNESSVLSGGWDLFSQDELIEEEMELTFVDEDESDAVLAEEETTVEAHSEADFDAPAPPQMERNTLDSQEENKEEVIATFSALETPTKDFENAHIPNEDAKAIGEERRFTLEDIDGDGFTLEIEDLDTPQEPRNHNDSIEDTQYDPFDLSLSEMPELKQKAEQESVESSFTLANKEFDLEPQAHSTMTEVETLDQEDPALHFQIKESETPAVKETPEEATNFDMDQPLSQMPKRTLSDLPPKIQDRMSRLQSFQYQFKANLQNLSEAERVPAYMRQGMEVDLDHKSSEQPSNIGVDNDGNIRTNNSFLHDNVD
jgi:cell division protein FtsZ